MISRRVIDHFRLWHVNENDPLYSWLCFLFKRAADYLAMNSEINCELPYRVSFREALRILAQRFHLNLMPQKSITSNILGVPIIARDKKRDWPVLLLPHKYDLFLVFIDSHQLEKITFAEAMHRYDQVNYLLMAKNGQSKNAIASFFPWPVVMIFSTTFLVLFILFGTLLLFLLNAFLKENISPLLFACAVVAGMLAIIGMTWQWLSQKNFALVYFLLLNKFFSRLFFSDEEFLAIDRLEHFRLITKIRRACTLFFFGRLENFVGCLGIFLFLFMSLFLWGVKVAISLTIGGGLIICLAFYVDKKQFAYNLLAQVIYQNIIKLLDIFRVSLEALYGLKAEKALVQKLHEENEELLAFVRRISFIDFFRGNCNFFLPVFFAVILAAVLGFMSEPSLEPYQRAGLLALVLSVGFCMALFIKRLHRGIDSLIEIDRQLSVLPDVQKTKVLPVHIRGAIELDDVSFAYKTNSEFIVKNYDLIIEAEKFYVLYGPSGVGKTTLLKIMMGVLEPEGGQVVIDGQDMRSLFKPSLRQYFGAVFLESKLFAGTVLQNIVCGRDISSTSLKTMLLTHEVFDCLHAMPLAMNTYVFWHTKNLSRYEKFIILLARALVHEPKILFVDEGLMGMSRYHQDLVLDYLNGLKMTRVITSYEKIQSPVLINVNLWSFFRGK